MKAKTGTKLKTHEEVEEDQLKEEDLEDEEEEEEEGEERVKEEELVLEKRHEGELAPKLKDKKYFENVLRKKELFCDHLSNLIF